MPWCGEAFAGSQRLTVRILIIEDDQVIAANLYDYLESRGHAVDAAMEGAMGLRMAVTQKWDIILLDLSLPGMSGLDLCQKLRKEAGQDTPVLMVTARDTLEDKLDGFARGADDYLVKPFALREVEARVTALAKRSRGRITNPALRVGDLVLHPETLVVERHGEELKLPSKCLRILELMMQNPNRVFRRAELEAAVWGEQQPDSDTLRTHIYMLRRALTERGGSDLIENIRGEGYKLVTPNANQA